MTTGDGDAGGRLFPEDLDGVDPVAAVMLADACRSIAAYPELVVAGALFTAAERVAGGWQVVCPCDPIPQGARELLAEHLSDRAALADWIPGRELRAAARSLAGEPLDELRVAGSHFRIVRIEQVVRTGPDGPEPPRPTDRDPAPDDLRLRPCRPYDLIPDGQTTPDIATAELLCQLLDATAAGTATEPGAFLTPVLLSPAFTVAERTSGRWRPGGRLHDTPQQARDSLATYFRHVVPAVEHPAAEELEEYTEAATQLSDRSRRNGLEVAGRRFRIVRIERIALMGAEGPEPPRPRDE
ncbi:DUF5954 family protein [Spirillospora sp. NPDC048911]|uniref:DUF5954 family protein n=1 Tax=Spirillospora sp. NPDC048911 TaxID=3364527 RepID=UPI00371515C2